jgi:hypothetical protein
MARPLATPDSHRGANGNGNARPPSELNLPDAGGDVPKRKSRPEYVLDHLQENDRLRAENGELRALCYELEQALQESSQQNNSEELDARVREYETLLEEKIETIQSLHQQLQETQATLQEVESQATQAVQAAQATHQPSGPAPREAELLALSEELERERRQLQEDEQALMEQMREMEVGMAKERAEMGRQRHDLQRLQGEIRHELERLEKSGAMQSKIDGLKTKLQDATNRRGAAHAALRPSAQGTKAPAPTPEPEPPKKKDSLMGRLFGSGK